MELTALVGIAVGLAMDAFAVASVKGLAMKRLNIKKALIIGAYFGFFQGLMPIIGYFLGTQFSHFIDKYDHWVVFILLMLIGINMIYEASKEDAQQDDSVAFKEMLILAIATSIDALSVGISFAFIEVQIFQAALIIGGLTFVLSVLAVSIGHVFGTKVGVYAEYAGGLILMGIAIHTLITSL